MATTKTQARAGQRRRIERARARRNRLIRRRLGVAVLALLALAGLVLWAQLAARPASGPVEARPAPAFTLPSTSGADVSLQSLRGGNVLLYFSEGVGCDPCWTQLVELEQYGDDLDAMGVTVLPLVTNPVSLTTQEAARFGVSTPVLVDADKAVSKAYDVLGRGHHADLPGHTFILVGPDGMIRWEGDYPGMYVSTPALLDEVRQALGP